MTPRQPAKSCVCLSGVVCLYCSASRMTEQFHKRFGYSTHDLLYHMVDVIADVAAISAAVDQENVAKMTLIDLLQEAMDAAFKAEAQRRALDKAGPKAPTVSDIGHA